MQTFNPVDLVVLQGTPFCNVNCSYCDLSAHSRRTRSIMSMDLIDRIFGQLFGSGLLADSVRVVWHSGEPLTLAPSYYEAAVSRVIAMRNAAGPNAPTIEFDIQTNGVLIDEDWCSFFKRHQSYFKVGISCDGPADMHDSFRRNWGGKPTHAKVLRAMEMLHAHGIKFKVIAVVTEKTLADPAAFYRFFEQRHHMLSGFHFNILASGRGLQSDLSYSADDRQQYYIFFRQLLDLGARANRSGDGFQIANFTQMLSRILREVPEGAALYMQESSAPVKSLTVDVEGNVTSFYAGLSSDVLADDYGDGRGLSLGNIQDVPLLDMLKADKFLKIVSDFRKSQDHCIKTCEYAGICSGGFEITKRTVHGRFDAGETAECIVHVKALADAILDDIGDHVGQPSDLAVAS